MFVAGDSVEVAGSLDRVCPNDWPSAGVGCLRMQTCAPPHHREIAAQQLLSRERRLLVAVQMTFLELPAGTTPALVVASDVHTRLCATVAASSVSRPITRSSGGLRRRTGISWLSRVASPLSALRIQAQIVAKATLESRRVVPRRLSPDTPRLAWRRSQAWKRWQWVSFKGST